MRHVAYAVVALALLAGAAWAQDLPGKRPAPSGPASPAGAPARGAANVLAIDSDLHVGSLIPDFELDGSRGGRVRRADLRGRWAVLVFDESRRRFAALESIYAPLGSMGVRLYGVCPDGWTALRDYSRRHGLSYELLSDPTRQASQVNDMYDPAGGRISPGVVVVDPAGVVRRVLDDQSPDGPEILDLARRAVGGAEPLPAARPVVTSALRRLP
jgi:peroxiredoxin